MWFCRTRLTGALLPTLALVGGCGAGGGDADDAGVWLAAARVEVSYMGYAEAHDLYGKVLGVAEPGGDLWAEATFGRAVCAQQIMPHTAASIAEAERLFRSFLEHRPESPWAGRSLLHLARLYEQSDYTGDAVRLETSRELYERVRADMPNAPEAGEATLRLAATYIRGHDTAEMRRGAAILEAWLDARPDDPLASGMWEYLAETYHKLGDPHRAVAAMVRADEAGLLLDANAMNQYWFIAHLAHHATGDRELAIRYYRRLIEDPLTAVGGGAYGAQLALIEMGVEPPLMPGQDELDVSLKRMLEQRNAQPRGAARRSTEPGA